MTRHDDALLRGGEILSDSERQRLCQRRRAEGIIPVGPVEITSEGRQLLKLLGLDTGSKKALAAGVSAVYAARPAWRPRSSFRPDRSSKQRGQGRWRRSARPGLR